ncbi:fungal-specific transcription factor [Podospora australis]|uniref:Fungal-specific transcription factor n=1 Tax=Podospora australis TaxID=1536484 RepID=A0AAN6WNX6_9PEZI|nr:fungal-specific transcription factor [Podospora australis]
MAGCIVINPSICSSDYKANLPTCPRCELCKLRKVKCDRGQPACGWCTRNGALCEYKERKKPGLRAGYGRELEQRLDRLEAQLREHDDTIKSHEEAFQKLKPKPGRPRARPLPNSDDPKPKEEDDDDPSVYYPRATPNPHANHNPQAETALFLQEPSASVGFGLQGAGGPTTASMIPKPSELGDYGTQGGTHMPSPSTQRTPASIEYGIQGNISAGTSAVRKSSSVNEYGMLGAVPSASPAMPDGYQNAPNISPRAHGLPSMDSGSGTHESYGFGPVLPPINSPPNHLPHIAAQLPAQILAPVPSQIPAGPLSSQMLTPMASQMPTPLASQMVPEYELPPYDLVYSLVDLYFKHINSWCPILHRKATFDALFPPSVTEEADKILMHAIVATTLRYSTDPRLTEENRQRYHDASKRRVILYGMENLSVKSLQALVILALDLCGTGNGPPGWNIMAIITRAVVQLGLAVESNSFSVAPSYQSIYTLRAMILPEARDFIEEESRRRLFWMVYLLDRYATVATAFEFALDDRDIDRRLPCRDDLWMRNQAVETRWFRTDDNQPTANGAGSHQDADNMGPFSYYIEILGILTKVHNFLKQPVDISAPADVERWQTRYKDLDRMFSAWKFRLPNEYGNMNQLFHSEKPRVLNCGWIMLHASYHTAVIRLHSSAAYPTTRSPIFEPSYSASQRCVTAVENLAALTEFVCTHQLLVKLGPPFAFSLWVAARVLLVHGSTVSHKLNTAQIGFFIDKLRDMGRHWPIATRYSELLSRVLDEHHDYERQGGAETPGIVKILSDMRRTAFDLDVLISRHPRHVPLGVNNAPSTGWQTPSKTPGPQDLESYDMFEFFNLPRLPSAHPGPSMVPEGSDHYMPDVNGGLAYKYPAGVVSGEFNITDFTIDVNRDWLHKEGEANFMS